MRLGDQTAAGIDISQDRISIVWLKTGVNGPEMLRSAVAPMPAGAVKDGNIEDAVLLSKAIRMLKHRNRIRTDRAAVSLFAKPVIMQIMDMPRQMPTNVRQFVHSEIKNCVVLPGRDIALDFCGISSAKRASGSAGALQAEKRVLAVAAENARMVELGRTCSRGGFSIETIEPALFAYLRAISTQKLAGKSGSNSLVALLRGNALTLCVQRNAGVDFIRTKEMAAGSTGPEELGGSSMELTAGWLADELSEVIRFYDMEAPENAGKWEITVFADTIQSTQDVEECLKSKLQAEHLQVRTADNAYMDTAVGNAAMAKDKQPSPVAIGLAMGLLAASKEDLKINLVPPQVQRQREIKRESLVVANVVAVMLLIMVLAINGYAFMIERATRKTVDKKQLITNQDTDMMLDQHQQLDARIEALSIRLDRIAQISGSHRDTNWTDVFNEIRKAAPASIRITNLSCQDGLRVQIEGLALTNEAVSSFVNLLEKSRNITSVVLLETRKQEGKNGFITYQLSCKLGNRSAKAGNVG